jgi:hypothetical protein
MILTPACCARATHTHPAPHPAGLDAGWPHPRLQSPLACLAFSVRGSPSLVALSLDLALLASAAPQSAAAAPPAAAVYDADTAVALLLDAVGGSRVASLSLTGVGEGEVERLAGVLPRMGRLATLFVRPAGRARGGGGGGGGVGMRAAMMQLTGGCARGGGECMPRLPTLRP